MKLSSTPIITAAVIIISSTFAVVNMQNKNQNSSLTNDPYNTKVDRIARSKFSLKTKKKAYNLETSPGLFPAITSLLGGSAVDTFTALTNITRLIQNTFPSSKPNSGNETTFSVNQAVQLFSRNLRGLRKVYDKELTRALNESDKNVLQFGKELKSAMRPFFEPNRNLTFVT